MILADRIRKYVLDQKIRPARELNQSTIKIVAGKIHSEMTLKNRMPAVCSALDADKFLDYARVKLINRSGPKQSSTATWVFSLEKKKIS
jgi:hypothetical protein